MDTIDLSDGCTAPVTKTVQGRTGTLGPYDLVVYRDGRRWRWAVRLDDELVLEGRTRTQEHAMRAAEAAAYRCYWA